jgi:hypothetical protein
MPIVAKRPTAVERRDLDDSEFALRGDRKYLISSPEAAVLSKARATAHFETEKITKRRLSQIIGRANEVIWSSALGVDVPRDDIAPDQLAPVTKVDVFCAANLNLFANAARESASDFDRNAFQTHIDDAMRYLMAYHGEILAAKIIRSVNRAMLGFKDGVAARNAAVAVCVGKRVCDLSSW